MLVDNKVSFEFFIGELFLDFKIFLSILYLLGVELLAIFAFAFEVVSIEFLFGSLILLGLN